MLDKNIVRFSHEEIIDCDVAFRKDKMVSVLDVMKYGIKNGFISEKCYTSSGTCPKDHFTINSCRAEKNVFIIPDKKYCYTYNIKSMQR